MKKNCILILFLCSLSFPLIGQHNKSFNILLSPSFSESGWNSFSNNIYNFGTYTPKKIGFDLGFDLTKKIIPKLAIYGKLENDFVFVRFNKNSKYFTNQTSFAAGLKYFIIEKENFSMPLNFDLGYGYHLEKYYSKTKNEYTTLKQGFFFTSALGIGVDLRIKPKSSLGFRTEIRYQKGVVNINLPSLDEEKFYDYKFRIIILYQYAF